MRMANLSLVCCQTIPIRHCETRLVKNGVLTIKQSLCCVRITCSSIVITTSSDERRRLAGGRIAARMNKIQQRWGERKSARCLTTSCGRSTFACENCCCSDIVYRQDREMSHEVTSRNSVGEFKYLPASISHSWLDPNVVSRNVRSCIDHRSSILLLCSYLYTL